MRLVLLLAVTLQTGCWEASTGPSDLQQVLQVSGMQLAADLPSKAVLTDDWRPGKIKATYDLKPNRTYVFVMPPPFDHAYFAEQIFPALLELKGFTVSKKPTRGSGYTHLFIGRPVYSIEFTRDGHRYSLTARYTPGVSEQFEMISEVFILKTPGF